MTMILGSTSSKEKLQNFSVNFLTLTHSKQFWMNGVLVVLVLVILGTALKLLAGLQEYPVPQTHLSLLEAPRDADIEAIQELDHAFTPSPAAFNKGYTSAIYWLKIDPSFLSPGDYLLSLNYGALDDVRLYIPSENGFEELRAGLTVPREQWPLDTTEIAFPLTVTEQENGGEQLSGREQLNGRDQLNTTAQRPSLYLRLSTSFSLQATVEIIPREILNWSASDTLWGAFYGCLIIMFLYNANVFFGTQEETYFFYSIHTLSAAFVIATLTGHGHILWPNNPQFDTYSITVGVTLYWILAIQFSRVFLHLPEVSQRLDRMFVGLMTAWSALFIIGVVGKLNLSLLTTPFSIFSCVAIIVAGIRCLHYPFARYFILAWSAYLVGIVIICLGFLGLLPRNTITIHAGEWGQLFETLVLAFALADRVRALREENLEAVRAREKTAKELLEMTQRRFNAALESTEIKDRFLATLSHEMRTPMHGILTPLTYIRDLNPSTEITNNLDMSIKCANDMKKMLDRLLRLSDLEAGRLTLHNKPIDLVASVADIMPTFCHRCTAKGLRFTYVLGNNVPRYVKTDGVNLIELLRIFLDNAVKFTEKGGLHLAIVKSESQSTASYVTLDIFITDSGVGFDNKTATNLFSKFLQENGAANRRYGGLGIDLAVAQNIVTQMHGEINFSSAKNKGTLFHIRLNVDLADHGDIIAFDDGLKLERRVQQAIQEELPQQAVQEKTGQPSGQTRATQQEDPMSAVANSSNRVADVNTKKLKPAHFALPVLIVEDDTTNQLIAKTIVSKMGFEVLLAPNGVEALTILQQKPCCVVLMDCQMPIKDGYETTRAIRDSAASYRNIPIIALTANAMEGDRQKCLDAGMNDYLSKPFAPSALRERIAYWVHVSSVAAANGDGAPTPIAQMKFSN